MLVSGGKCCLTFNSKGKSDAKIMRFCQSVMAELYKYTGKYTNVYTSNINVSISEINYLFGQFAFEKKKAVF